MTGRHTTTRSRQLGAELKRVRERTDYSARDLARALGWSETTHETTATLINQYEPLVVPGLLQTESYAKALFRLAGRVPSRSECSAAHSS